MDKSSQPRKVPEVVSYPAKDEEGITKDQVMAIAALDPSVKAMALTRAFLCIEADSLNSGEVLNELMKIGRKARDGDLGGIEAMLAAQAYSLDAIFGSLALRAKANMGEYTKSAELYMKLALRAQSQCRATAETLALMKNPLPYIRQANLANQMQVNNGQPVTQAREISPDPNELLTRDDHEALDFGGKAAAGNLDPQLATLGKLHRG